MTIQELEKVATPRTPQGRTGLAIGLAIVLATGLAVAAFAVGRSVGTSSSKRSRSPIDAIGALSAVTQISRPQDGLLYGEWVRDHILRRCPAFAPTDIILVPRQDGSGWIVNSQFRSGTKDKGPCAQADIVEDLAFVSAAGQVERIPVQWDGPHVISLKNHEEILPTVPQGGALLDHYKSGEAP